MSILTFLTAKWFSAWDEHYIGVDEFGNEYYKRFSTRYVKYSEKSINKSLPPEWYAWIHYIVDKEPESNLLDNAISKNVVEKQGLVDKLDIVNEKCNKKESKVVNELCDVLNVKNQGVL